MPSPITSGQNLEFSTDQQFEIMAKRAANPKPVKRAKRRAPRGIGRPKEKRGVGKDALIDKTVDFLRRTPPEKLSLTAAANHAGVHLTLFKYYFHDRTQLLVDVAWYLNRELSKRIQIVEGAQSTPTDRIHIRIDALIEFYLLNPFYHRLMLEILAAEDSALSQELISVWLDKTLDMYREIFRTGVADGTLRPLDELYTYLAILGLCEQFHHSVRLSSRIESAPGATSQQALDRYRTFVHELIFKGISAGG
jgi:AcrR family transcriptional regulator